MDMQDMADLIYIRDAYRTMNKNLYFLFYSMFDIVAQFVKQ